MSSSTPGATTSSISQTGLGATLRDIFLLFRDLFQGLNLENILTRRHQGLCRIHSAPDKYAEIAIIIEIIFIALDDGSQ